MVSKEPETTASVEEHGRDEGDAKKKGSGSESPKKEDADHIAMNDTNGVTRDSNAVRPESESSDTALTPRTSNSATRPSSLDSHPDETPQRQKGLAKNGFDRLEIQKPKLTGNYSFTKKD